MPRAPSGTPTSATSTVPVCGRAARCWQLSTWIAAPLPARSAAGRTRACSSPARPGADPGRRHLPGGSWPSRRPSLAPGDLDQPVPVQHRARTPSQSRSPPANPIDGSEEYGRLCVLARSSAIRATPQALITLTCAEVEELSIPVDQVFGQRPGAWVADCEATDVPVEIARMQRIALAGVCRAHDLGETRSSPRRAGSSGPRCWSRVRRGRSRRRRRPRSGRLPHQGRPAGARGRTPRPAGHGRSLSHL